MSVYGIASRVNEVDRPRERPVGDGRIAVMELDNGIPNGWAKSLFPLGVRTGRCARFISFAPLSFSEFQFITNPFG